MKQLRFGFRAKILVALVGTVVLLVGSSILLIRQQVRAQVDVLVDGTVERAARGLEEVEQLRAQQLDRLGDRFTGSIRVAALMESAVYDRELELLADHAEYELQLARLPPALLVFRDLDGVTLLRILDDRVILGDAQPSGQGTPSAQPVDADDCSFETARTRYVVEDGILYTSQHCFIFLFDEPLGTLTLGLALDDGVAGQVGDVVGAEVCLLMEGECLAASPGVDRQELAAAAVGGASQVVMAGGRRALVSRPLPEAPLGAELVLAVPLDGVLDPFDRIQRAETVAGALALLLALLLGLALSQGLAGPVRTLVRATERVGKGEYDFRVEVPSKDEMGDLAIAFNQMLAGLELKEKYRGVLEKAVSRDVADEMLKGEIRLGGETRRVTTLFADLRGFTALTEGLESQVVIGMLNEWFDRAAEAVEREGGVVDKFLGDGLMAIFGAPIPHEDHTSRGIRAAIGIRDGTAELNRERAARGEPPLEVGIGLSTGDVAAGNSGSRNRMNYTVLGETVNLAARLCGEAGGGEILLAPETWEEGERHSQEFLTEAARPRQVKGLSYEIRPRRVLGWQPDHASA
ncbi:MAG: adenylate/guanylate cyclase domain-containing protein [Gemmatimonadota bacterium]